MNCKEMSENDIIQVALCTYVIDLHKRRNVMRDNAFNKKTNKYCFSNEELSDYERILKNIEKSKELLKKYSPTE